MFERFTDEARAVVVHAQAEARELRHHYVGTEHLLLGLLRAAGTGSAVLGQLGIGADDVRSDVTDFIDGSATEAEPVHDDATALRAIGIDLDEVRDRIEAAFGPGALDRPVSRSHLWRRRRCDDGSSGRVPFTPRAKKVLELSLREAVRLRDPHIGTEHVLLGLAREGVGLASRILVERGVTPDDVRRGVALELSRRDQRGRSA